MKNVQILRKITPVYSEVLVNLKNIQSPDFVGGRRSYLRYLCLFEYNGVQHIDFVLCCMWFFSFILCTLHFFVCCQFLWIVPFWL